LAEEGVSFSFLWQNTKAIAMPGLVPGIHVFLYRDKTWMAGTSPAMTS
jgi:hypothetical protein